MKKIKFGLVLALFSLFAASCQKENLMNPPSNVEEQVQSVHHLSYWVDGVHNSITLQNEKAISDFFYGLTRLSILGHQIRISNDDLPSSENPSKDVVKFSTKSEEDFIEWLILMDKEGYEVYYHYDKETGTFHGTATKK